MGDGSQIEIRSYRAVFDLERRLYRVDGFRLNPSGVPVRGLVYLAGLVVAVLALQRGPLVGSAVAALPWQLRYVAVPCGLAALLTILRVDGRPAHVALAAIVRFALAPRQLAGFARRGGPGTRWSPPAVTFLDDGSGGGRQRLRFRGPGAVFVRAPFRMSEHRRRAVLSVESPKAEEATPRVVSIRSDAVLDVRVGG